MALDAALKSVSAIKKADLTELKSFVKAPSLVETTLLAVCALLGRPVDKGWTDVKKAMQDAHFMAEILCFDSRKSRETKRFNALKAMKYIKNEEWTCERVKRASKAGASLALWVQSQIKFIQLPPRPENLTVHFGRS